MRKNTLFLSVVLTTFMLAVLFGVASAFQKTMSANSVAQSEPVAQVEPVTEVQSTKSESTDQLISLAPTGVVSPEQAAALAAQTLGHNDVYSVESTTYEGAAAYLVTFSSGDLVYLSSTGQILAITKPEPVVVVINQPNRDHIDRPGNNGGDNSSGDDHGEDQESHEEEHED